MGEPSSTAVARISWPDRDNAVPRQLFTDQALFDLEMQRIFAGPTWHLVAHEAEVPGPGDYKTWYIGQRPIIIVRDKAQKIHVLENACAHRGAQLLTKPYGSVERETIRCLYHSWAYHLDGSCRGVALPDHFPPDFRKEDYGLRKFRTETLAGAVFATGSAETPPLREYLGDERLEAAINRVLCGGNLQLLGAQKVIINSNWKIYAENVADNYHAILLHTGSRLLSGERLREEVNHCPNHQHYAHVWTDFLNANSPQKAFRDMSIVDVRTKPKDVDGHSISSIISIFPVSHFYDQGDAMTIRFVRPLATDRVLVQFTVFGRADESEELKRHRVRQASNLFGPEGLVTLEDATAFARVQAGARASGCNYILKGTDVDKPPFVGNSEAGIRHFYSTYRRLMDL